MVEPIAGVILAGGASSRMGGGDKCLLEFGGTTLIERIAARLAPQVEASALSANGRPERFSFLGLPVIADAAGPPAGPLAGVLSGMRWAAGRSDGAGYLATLASDTPFFPTDLVARLAAAAGGRRGIVLAASMGRTHPVVGLWPLALAEDLAAYLAAGESRRVDAYAGGRHPVTLVDFAPLADGFDPFFNVNTPEDLATASRRLAREGI